MKRVTAIGRLARDPERRSASTGVQVCRMHLAVACRKRRDEDQGAVFIDVVAFEAPAGARGNVLSQGSQLSIDARLEHRTCKGRDGSVHGAHEVIAGGRVPRRPQADHAHGHENTGTEPSIDASTPRDPQPTDGRPLLATSA